jgi:hypothetical protein
MGWLIEADELNDGRLQVRRILKDPNMECVNGCLIPENFPDSLEFQIFSDAIIAMEGHQLKSVFEGRWAELWDITRNDRIANVTHSLGQNRVE